MKAIWYGLVLGLVSFSLLLRGTLAQDCHSDNNVNFQILTDRNSYPQGGSVRVKFIITNTGGDNLYLSRLIMGCSSPIGFASLEILDIDGRSVKKTGCAIDVFPPKDDEIPAALSDSASWVHIGPKEVYGGERSFDLPLKAGIYRLKAILFPTSFTDKQKQTLSKDHIRVVRYCIPASPVTIRVK